MTFIMQHKFSKTNWFINAYIHRKKYLSPKFYKMRWFGGNLKVLCHIIKLKSFRKINRLVSLGWLLNLFLLSLAGCLENIKKQITLLWRKSLSYRNQSIDLLCKWNAYTVMASVSYIVEILQSLEQFHVIWIFY